MSQIPDWVYAFRKRIPDVLERYSAGKPGWYRLCAEGDRVAPGPDAGLSFSCLAAKVAAQCGVWEQFPADHRQAWIERIQSFQRPDGLFSDPVMERRAVPLYTYACIRQGRWGDLFRPNWQVRWAETRQAAATLVALGAAPLRPIDGFPREPQAINAFLAALDWRQPWSAGAQVGHLLFFLKHGAGSEEERQAGLQAVLNHLDSLESAQTGGWYRQSAPVSNQDMINGAMKVMAGLSWWDQPVRHAEALLKTALSDPSDEGDCALTNRLFVLHRLGEQLDSPPGEAVTGIVHQSTEAMCAYFQPDGGLSATPKGSLRRYYYAPVSRGKPVGDLHGLALLTWGMTLAAHLVEEADWLGWKLIAP